MWANCPSLYQNFLIMRALRADNFLTSQPNPFGAVFSCSVEPDDNVYSRAGSAELRVKIYAQMAEGSFNG